MAQDEVPLTGGNATAAVVRVGDTVRRPAGPWTPAVHALLTHLHAVGFTAAPRALGIDERGREVLSYAPGVAAHPDHEDVLDPDSALARVGRLVRHFHDAVAGFVPPLDAAWQVLIPADGAEIVAHHDLAPWNLVVGERGAFIDWDSAAPGTRLWDLAYAAHGFVPLSADPQWSRPDPAARLRVFVEAYGLDEADRRRLLLLLAPRTRSMADFLAAQAALGNEPWTRLWNEGHGHAWSADADHIERHADDWSRALLG
jgi:aminoglycoside phosphotransferase (APT) family kinase protein